LPAGLALAGFAAFLATLTDFAGRELLAVEAFAVRPAAGLLVFAGAGRRAGALAAAFAAGLAALGRRAAAFGVPAAARDAAREDLAVLAAGRAVRAAA
jgi:D-arabinose 5-phosphate isomerase GutQ